jgi:hypothetical protein
MTTATTGNDKESSDEKHWSHVDYYWCIYDDKLKRICPISPDHHPCPGSNAFRVPVTMLNKSHLSLEDRYVQRFKLAKVDDLFRLADQFDRGIPKPLYRGQSDYTWNLTTHLERDRPEFVVKETGLERYEHHLMTNAQQRFHEFFTQLPDEDDYLSWLALLRHRGVPTRLLDVTRSFLIACYFALRDAKPKTDAAVWIFARDRIENSFSDWSWNANKTWLRTNIYTIATYGEPMYWPFPRNDKTFYSPPTIEELKHPVLQNELNYRLTIDAAMRGFVEKPGIAVLEPSWLSRRMDFQQGAFLLPFNVRYDFEYNLFSYLDMFMVETEERNIPTDKDELLRLWSKTKVIKLRIPTELHNILKLKLETMNIRELTLFPDLDGALAHLSAFIPNK